ncbi:MAG: M20/M25/M40 family metallo-hydrolase [Anaerolineae bacterium]|nr:M20/M25/M40 family metallo-hydrolase [Anaerolineae bacterium]
MKRHHPPFILALLSVFLTAVTACTLSTTRDLPPTIVPRATDTPLPTIAYSTLRPEELPQAQQPSSSSPAVGGNLSALLSQVESDRMYLNIDALQRFQTRHVNSPNLPDSGINAAAQYITTQFEKIRTESNGNLQVFPQSFQLTWNGLDTVQKNIIGLINGQSIGGGVIVIGAHYDSISIDRNDGTYYAPGADDNGSGVAALIELARILSRRPHRATIMLVAFSAEEVGRQGSRAFVQYLQEKNIPVDAMFSLDIIGSSTGPNGEVVENQLRVFSDGPNDAPGAGFTSRQLARAIQFTAASYIPSMNVTVEDVIDRQGRYSDHMSFNEAGWPAVRFIEPLEDVKRQHTPNDTIDDVQASYLTRATQTILAAVTTLADGPPPPQNIVLRDNGNGTRTLVWEHSPDATSYRIALRRPGALTYNMNESFPWTGNSVDWNGFDPALFTGVVIMAVDANGLMGAPSAEYPIR